MFSVRIGGGGEMPMHLVVMKLVIDITARVTDSRRQFNLGVASAVIVVIMYIVGNPSDYLKCSENY